MWNAPLCEGVASRWKKLWNNGKNSYMDNTLFILLELRFAVCIRFAQVSFLFVCFSFPSESCTRRVRFRNHHHVWLTITVLMMVTGYLYLCCVCMCWLYGVYVLKQAHPISFFSCHMHDVCCYWCYYIFFHIVPCVFVSLARCAIQRRRKKHQPRQSTNYTVKLHT